MSTKLQQKAPEPEHLQDSTDPVFYSEVDMSDLISQYAEEVETFRQILELPDSRDTLPRSPTTVLGLDDEKGQQELRSRGPSAMLPLNPILKYPFEKFEQDFLASNLPEGKYIKPPASTTKYYKVGQPCFEDKLQELNTDFAKISISPKPSVAPMGKVPQQVLKELEQQARQNLSTINFTATFAKTASSCNTVMEKCQHSIKATFKRVKSKIQKGADPEKAIRLGYENTCDYFEIMNKRILIQQRALACLSKSVAHILQRELYTMGNTGLLFIYFIYLGFYVAFNTVQVISRRVVGRAEETSTYSSLGLCTVNCRPTASNYQLSHLRPSRGSNPRPQRWEVRVLPLCHRGPHWPSKMRGRDDPPSTTSRDSRHQEQRNSRFWPTPLFRSQSRMEKTCSLKKGTP